MSTATIMSAIAATGIAPASSGGTVPAQPATAGQPFGALMAAVQAAVGDGAGQLAETPALPVPAPAMAAGTLVTNGTQDALLLPVPETPDIEGEPVPVALPTGTEDLPEQDAPELVLDQPAKAVEQGDAAGDQPAPVQVAEADEAGEIVTLMPEKAPVRPKPARQVAAVEAEVRHTIETSDANPAPMPQAAVPDGAPTPQPVQQAVMAAQLPAQPANMAGRQEVAVALVEEQDMQTGPVRDRSNAVDPATTDNGTTKTVAQQDKGPALAALPAGNDNAAAAQTPVPGFAQAIPVAALRGAAAHLYGAGLTQGGTPDQPVVSAQAGQISRDMGVAIARGVDAGREALFVRLDPAEMGRIHVRLSFETDGRVHVAMTADSAVALDMLRREAGDLGRALNDAGVRADSQSFRFDGGQGQGQGQGFAQQRGGNQNQSSSGGMAQDATFLPGTDIPADAATPHRGMRSAGGLNLII